MTSIPTDFDPKEESGRSLAGRAFVGRTTEVHSLRAAWREIASSSGPRLVLVAGETGVGKSRLVTEFLAWAVSEGSIIARAEAPVFTGSEIPYASTAPLVRQLAATGPDIADWIQRSSELVRLAGGAASVGPVDVTAPSRMFEEFLGLVTAMGDGPLPVIVVVEDVHWADGATRDLLAYALGKLVAGRILVLLTYRDTDLEPSSPWSRLLVELLRLPITSSIHLDALSASDTATMLRALVPAASDRAIARAAAQSGGNPLYAEQLAAGDLNEVPRSLFELVDLRLSRIDPGTARLLRLLATFGPATPIDLLDLVADRLQIDSAPAVIEAKRTGLIEVDAGSGTYRFHHPILHEIIYARLAPPERRRLHRAIGSALAGLPATPSAESIIVTAHHLWRGGDLGQALPWMIKAGSAAESVLAFEAAWMWFERALVASASTLSQQRTIGFKPSSTAGADRDYDLKLRAGRAATLAGHPNRAVEILETLKADAPDARLLAELADARWATGDRVGAIDAYGLAIAQAYTLPIPDRGRLLRMGARASLVAGDAVEALQLAEAAVASASAGSEPSDETEALTIVASAQARLGAADAAIVSLERAGEVAARAQRNTRPAARASRVIDLLADFWVEAEGQREAGHTRKAAEVASAGAARAAALGIAKGWGGLVGASAIDELRELGKWQDADALLDELPADRQAPEVILAHARILAQRGRMSEAAAEVARAHADEYTAEPFGSGLASAEVAIWSGQPAEAWRVAVEALLRLSPRANPVAAADLATLAMRAAADRAERARAFRSVSEFALIEQEASVVHGVANAVATMTGAGSVATSFLRLAAAEHERLLGQTQEKTWAALSARFKDLEYPMREAYAHWRAAEAATAGSRRETARDHLREAWQIATSLGAEPLRTQIEQLARRARIELVPAKPGSGPADAGRGPMGGLRLSAREIEVLALLSEGRSNREIATALFITEKTAGHHVSHILAKLDVRSRVEAAGMAIRLGMAGGPAIEHRQELEGSASAQQAVFLLMTDIVSSTALVEAIGDQAWADVIRWHDQMLRNQFGRYRGREIDHAGDGFLVSFPDLTSALDCAIAVQRALADHRQRNGFAPRVRAGIHAASVIVDPAGMKGLGVHIVARIASAASGDEVVVSADSLGRLDGRYPRLEPREIELRGVSRPVVIVPIDWRNAAV